MESSKWHDSARYSREQAISLYVGIGAYICSMMIGTWHTSWGVELSGTEALRVSFGMVTSWPAEFISAVAFNMEFYGWSLATSTIGTLNWMLWDSVPVILFVFVLLSFIGSDYGIEMKKIYWGFLFFLVITDLIMGFIFVGIPRTITDYPSELFEWRLWEIVAMWGVIFIYNSIGSESEGANPSPSTAD